MTTRSRGRRPRSLVRVGGGAAHEGRVRDPRVDDERVAPVVIRADREPVGVLVPGLEHVTALERHARAVDILIADGLCVVQLADRGLDREAPVGLGREVVRARVCEPDVTRIRARRDVELVLEGAVLAAEDHVDLRPQVVVDELVEGGNIRRRVAVRTDQIVDRARRPITGLERRIGVRAEEPQVERQSGTRVLREREHRLVVGEEERIARSLRDVAYVVVGLADVRGEAKVVGRLCRRVACRHREREQRDRDADCEEPEPVEATRGRRAPRVSTANCCGVSLGHDCSLVESIAERVADGEHGVCCTRRGAVRSYSAAPRRRSRRGRRGPSLLPDRRCGARLLMVVHGSRHRLEAGPK